MSGGKGKVVTVDGADEDYWNARFWSIIGPSMLVLIVLLGSYVWWKRLPTGYSGDVFPCAFALIWLVLIQQNIIAQMVTGPLTV